MKSNNLKGDISGAFSVAVTAIPQSIGYGLIAFALLGPNFFGTAATLGILAAVIGGSVAALAGGTSIQISGPKAPLTMIYAAVVASLVGQAQGIYQQSGFELNAVTIVVLASVSLFVAAVFQLLLGTLKFGGVVKYVPYTVVSGFMNGVALLIIGSQLRPFLGLAPDTEFFQVVSQPGLIEPLTLMIGAITLGTVYLARHYVRVIPGVLVALILGSLLHHTLDRFQPGLQLGSLLGAIDMDVSGVGGIVRIQELLNIPGIMLLLPALLISGLVLGLISSMESLLSAVVCDNLTGERHDSNRELIGQGFANLLCSAAGALPSAGSIPRSVQNYRAGGRTAFSGVAGGVMVLLMFSTLSPVIGMVPLAVIAGLLMSVALDLFDDWTKNLVGKLRTHRSQRKEVLVDLGVAALVAGTTVSINIVAAVGVGIAIASILFMARMGKSVVRRTYTGDNVRSRKIRSRVEMESLARNGSSITVYELQGPIFFGSADRLAADIELAAEQMSYVILDLQRVTDIDSTGAKILARLAKHMRTIDHYLLVSSINEDQPLWDFLEVMDVVKEIGDDFFFPDTDCALEWTEDDLLQSMIATTGLDNVPLANMDIMNNMQEDELKLLQQMLKQEFWHKKQAVFREGDTETDLYIVIKGSVSIKKHLSDSVESKRLVTFGPGSVFGEMALIDNSPRSADAWADTNCELMRLPHAAFLELCRDHPQVANKLLSNIATEISFKLRRTSAALASMEST